MASAQPSDTPSVWRLIVFRKKLPVLAITAPLIFHPRRKCLPISVSVKELILNQIRECYLTIHSFSSS